MVEIEATFKTITLRYNGVTLIDDYKGYDRLIALIRVILFMIKDKEATFQWCCSGSDEGKIIELDYEDLFKINEELNKQRSKLVESLENYYKNKYGR